jgi:ribosomal-protein-alanine N-acetyltransferase
VATTPTGVTVRRVEEPDLRAILRIERAAFDQPWPYAVFERFLDERGFLVAERNRDGEIVGYVVGDLTAGAAHDIGHVKDLAVAPQSRRQGIGRTLLDQALAALVVGGAAVVKLEVRASNETARALYRDVGFAPAKRIDRYYRDGEDAVVMTLDVTEWQRTDRT